MHSNELKRICTPCLDAFGLTLDGDSALPPLQILKESGTSIVVRARCKQNGAPCDLVLKGSPAELHRQPLATPAVEAAISRNADGVTVPARFVTIQSGAPYLAGTTFGADSIIWSVTPFVPHTPSFDWLTQSSTPWNGKQARSAGALLAKMHAASQAARLDLLASGCTIEPSIASNAPWLLLDALGGVNADYHSSIGLRHLDDQRLVAIASKAVLVLENSVHAKAIKAEEIVVHGDYQPGNVLYRDDDAFGLVDWDYAHLENPLMDVAYGLIMFAGNLTAENMAPFDTSLSRQFLEGYIDQITIRGQEPVCMPDCFFTPDVRDNHVFSSYMKLSAALIMLWSLSDFGQQHPCGLIVARQSARLMQML